MCIGILFEMCFKYFKSSILVLFLIAVLQEAECRRKILRGRKTVTRWYMKPPGVPAWAVVILVAIGQLVFGGGLYILLKVCILDKPIAPRYQQIAPPREV
ncbi:unnamed protein product [Acanthoscelides obtectus]|uniref:Uncharacterized protein n=1 Tax=Acanthoscelides obtectus TaxID=200917 RepID=A0A9P0P9A4_ACAOB|nr:unnamed protein product [Acanthoscelides obtectus]CAK1662872.1 hypothetical protein AOBTE_LOCUS23356 [Acanthoscelides obtectus]